MSQAALQKESKTFQPTSRPLKKYEIAINEASYELWHNLQ